MLYQKLEDLATKAEATALSAVLADESRNDAKLLTAVGGIDK